MKIEAIALLRDNYAWLLTDEATGECAVVDPSEAAPVDALLVERSLKLRWILATHHHWDHVNGIEGLLEGRDGVEVFCSSYDFEQGRIPGATRAFGHGDSFELWGLPVQCMSVPGHTLGAVAFYMPSENAVFTGDTLFTGGCGRLFEGTPQQMHTSLSLLNELPQETLVYCGHEYTEKNMCFALTLEPENETVVERLARVREARAKGEATVPAPLSTERGTNPFLRSDDSNLGKVVGFSDPVQVFAAIRSLRNDY